MSKLQLKTQKFKTFINRRFLVKALCFLVSMVLFGISFFILYKIYNKFIYSFGFTDEGDNISIGKFLLMGQNLYKDIFSQHQPLAYYISAFIQYLTRPDNILLVIRRHRQFVMLFSFSWIVFLVIRFGVFIVPFVFIIEIAKYYFLGHLFLAEGLVIYPLSLMFLLWWKSWTGDKLSIFDAVVISLSSFFTVFNLFPVVLVVIVFLVTFAVRNRKDNKVVIFLFTPLIFLITVLFTIVPIVSYIEGTLWANIFYYIPNSSKFAFNIKSSFISTLFNAAFYPLTVFFRKSNALITIYRYLSISFIFLTTVFILTKKKLRFVLGMIFILFISNLRPGFASNIFYHAFHSLPHFALFVFSIYILFFELFKFKISKNIKIIPLIPIIIVFAYFFTSKSIYYRENINDRDISYINFAEVFTYSSAINTLSDDGDTLAVIPHEELLYWYPGLLPATRFLFYEAWVHDVPKFKAEIYKGLRVNPPTFVYWSEDELEPFLKTADYASVPKNTATYSSLHIYKEKIPEISDSEWKSLEVHGFKKVELN